MSSPTGARTAGDGTLGAPRRAPSQSFFIQVGPKQPWCVETVDNCEVMLCGKFVSVDDERVRIQYRWGPRKCPDCFMLYMRGER